MTGPPPADRVVIVTGAARGIGGGIARRFARSGAALVVNDLNGDALAVVTEELAAAGGEVVAVVGDITADETVDQVRTAAGSLRGGRIDVLVNNVGDFRPASRTFLHSTPEQWQRLYELNLRHVLTLTHAVLPTMVEQRSGSIVNNATVEAFRGIPGHAAYSAYNAGVVAFTRSLAVEVGRFGVRVNAIAPDLADTDQTPAAAMLRGRDPSLVGSWLPLGRFGDPDDYAAVVEFLASDAARFVTGQTIPVDGGTLAASGWYGRADGKGWTNLPTQA